MISSSDLLQIVRGILMGSADIIPGVSGGTVALILGIYERLVKAISQFDLKLLGLIRKKRFADAATHTDIQFLGLLFLGIGIGILGLASLMHYLLNDQEHIQTNLVVASVDTIEMNSTTGSGGLPKGTIIHVLRQENNSGQYNKLGSLKVASFLDDEKLSDGSTTQHFIAQHVSGISVDEINSQDIIVQPSRRRPPTYAFFFGLIVASSLLVARMVPRWSAGNLIAIAAGALFAFWLVGLPFLKTPPTGAWYAFVVGVIAICAMILPGISGAFIMLIMGKYDDITGALRALAHGDITAEGGLTLAAFGLGAALGIISFSKVLRWLLAHYEAVTLAILCGFMLGSLRTIWPFKTDMTPHVEVIKKKVLYNTAPDFSDQLTWLCLGMALLGIFVVLMLDKVSRRMAQRRENKAAVDSTPSATT